MNKTICCLVLNALAMRVYCQNDTITPSNSNEPFSQFDLTWCNGSDKRKEVLTIGNIFSPVVMLDGNCTYSFNNPIDNTVVGSTALARNNEMQISAVHLGGDFNYKNARAHVVTQFGTRSTVVPRNDYSPYRGQYQLADAYRYLAEANAGYHFNVWYGVNIDAGMFMSYIGLNSYYQTENWEYQASFTSDNTPWFFNGIRLQLFPLKNLKIEPWIINGWQSYGMYNQQPGIGGNITWCPNERLKLLTNNYYGADAAGIPKRKRFHSDNSLLYNYFKQLNSPNVSQMAFSFTGDIGFEKGGGVNGFKSNPVHGPKQYFASFMFYNRVWFAKNKFAWTVGGGYVNNPGRYLVLYPTGQASPLPSQLNPIITSGTFPFSANAGDVFEANDFSTNFDWMPNDHVTFRLECVHRKANVNYFSGRGGVTSQTGYSTSSSQPDWKPDLVKSETRILFALLFRL